MGCFSGPVFAQTGEGIVPEVIRRPQRGETPRYPRDAVIGDLGRGQAPEAAYRYARTVLGALLAGNREAPQFAEKEASSLEGVFEDLGRINPEKYRLGSGREEPDGTTSFLFRFIGREQGITGELYLRSGENGWRLDDVFLEEPRGVSDYSDYGFDFSPYERFF